MANVTGYSGTDEGTFSRRGSGAGKFQRPGADPGLFGGMLNQLRGALGGMSPGPQITGDIAQESARVTQGGMGRNRGLANVTQGTGGLLSGAAQGAAQNVRNLLSPGGLAFGSTALGLMPGAIGITKQQGLGAGITSTAAGLGAAAITAPISQGLMASPNLGAKIAGLGLQFAAPALAQAGVAGLMGGVGEGKKGAGGADVSVKIPGTPEVPMSDAARERIQRERDLQYEVDKTKRLGQLNLALDNQAAMDRINTNLQYQRSLQPLVEQILRQQLVNKQAQITSETAAYQQLGRQAGMFNLAGLGMTEAGAFARTAISSNPYANSVIQAPSISFG